MIAPREIAFHAEVDGCAVVYPSGRGPDALLAAFIRRRLAEGYDAVGLIQRRTGDGGDGPEFALMSDAAAPPHALARTVPDLPAARTALSACLKRRPDVLVLNRFGRAEVEGGGLWDVLADAIDDDVPVVIAVPDGLVDRWRARGAGVLAQARAEPESLERWWRSLRGDVSIDPCVRFCERSR